MLPCLVKVPIMQPFY